MEDDMTRQSKYAEAIEHLEVSIGFRDDAGDDDWASGMLERDDLNSIAHAVMAVADAEIRKAKAEAWDEGFTRGFYDPLAGGASWDASESATPNPYD